MDGQGITGESDDHLYEGLVSVESCCEKYIELYRGPSPPSVEEFASQYPELKSEILELLPTVLMLEKARDRNLGKRKDGRVASGPTQMPELNDFELIAEIGRGGMGIVYEANQVSLDRRVALKVLPKHALSEKQVGQFQAEAATAAKLHHTNIAPIYGVGEKDGVHYFAMQLLEGRTLDEDQLDLSTNEVVIIGQQVARALQYAHDQGVFHRDVKPGNLIFDRDSNVWVTDFGLAVTREGFDSNSGKHVSGTIRYMPPEALAELGQDSPGYDLRLADIYSLSVTLMELFTTKPVFRSTSAQSLTETIKKGETQPLMRAGKPLPRDLQAILLKAASVDPSTRYQTAKAFEEDLNNFASGRPVKARQTSVLGQVYRWAKREPRLAFASGLAVLSVISTSLVTTFSYLSVQTSLEAERRQRTRTNQVSTVGAESIERIFQRYSRYSMFSSDAVPLDSEPPPLSADSAGLMLEMAEFYERLALDNAQSDLPVKAIMARCHVGEIEFRLGSYPEAKQSFTRALNAYSKLLERKVVERNAQLVLRLAKIRNQLGQVLKVSGDRAGAKFEQEQSVKLLEGFASDHPDQVTEEVRLELARSMYLATHNIRPGMGPNSLPPNPAADDSKRPDRGPKELVIKAIQILEKSSDFQKPNSNDIRLQLLALCHQELASDRWGDRNPENEEHHDKSVEIFKELASRKPSLAQIEFGLMRTSAEIDIHESSIGKLALEKAYESLREATKLGRKLVEEHPESTAYRIELVHAQFKLGIVARKLAKVSAPESKKELGETEEQSIRRAMLGQGFLARQYPESKAYKVWIAKFALELAQCNSMSKDHPTRKRLISRALNLLFNLPKDYQEREQVAAVLKVAKSMSHDLLIETDERSSEPE